MKVKYILLTIFIFLFMTPDAYAYCGRADMSRIKDIANKISLTAQYAKDENGNDTGKYNVIISNLTDEIYIIEELTKNEYYYDSNNNGTIVINNLENQKYKFNIHYERCDDELIRTIDYTLPKYNHYANDPLCEGISEEELDVCGRLYQEELDDETFYKKIEEYLSKTENKEQTEKTSSNLYNKIIEILKKYYIYIIATIVLIVIITSTIVINKKRGALE